MKNVFFCLLLVPVMGWGQSSCGTWNNGVLRAEVTGDTVILHNDTAFRNCGVMYHMKTGLIGDTLIWLQVDTGWVYGCMCHFDLSVTLDSVKTGSYAAKVYYTTYPPNYYPPDTCLAGIITFEVTKPSNYLLVRKAGEGQSDCYTLPVGISERQAEKNALELYPNPVADRLHIRTTVAGRLVILVSDIQGTPVTETVVTGSETVIDLKDLLPGIYFLKLSDGEGSVVRRFCKVW